MASSITILRCIAVTALTGLACAARVLAADAPASPVGDYLCMSGGTCPCEKDTKLRLKSDGKWQYGTYAGTYRAGVDRIEFDGNGAAASWGTATIGEYSLTFHVGANPIVCWMQKPKNFKTPES